MQTVLGRLYKRLSIRGERREHRVRDYVKVIHDLSNAAYEHRSVYVCDNLYERANGNCATTLWHVCSDSMCKHVMTWKLTYGKVTFQLWYYLFLNPNTSCSKAKSAQAKFILHPLRLSAKHILGYCTVAKHMGNSLSSGLLPYSHLNTRETCEDVSQAHQTKLTSQIEV